MGAYILIAVITAMLYAFWVVFNWAFDLIEQAHRKLREEAAREREDPSPTRGTGSC